MRWAWPLAARTAHQIHDEATTSELLALLDAHPAGHLPPILRAERQLTRARVLVESKTPRAGPRWMRISARREVASPHHLAHALVDRAEQLVAAGDSAEADVLIPEADSIGTKLKAEPLLGRAAAVQGAGQPA